MNGKEQKIVVIDLVNFLVVALFFSLLVFTLESYSQQSRWRLAKETAGNPIAAVDIYRRDPDTLYAIGSKILRSADRGQHWDTVNAWGTDVGALKVDPTNSQILYLSRFGFTIQGNDVSTSTDGGYNWSPVFIGRIFPAPVIEIDPVDPKTVYVGAGPSYILRTTDRGQTWDTTTYPGGNYFTSLAIDPANDSVLYAGYYTGIFKSTDKGRSWIELALGVQIDNATHLGVDPNNTNIVYAGIFGRGVYKSTDGGGKWVQKNNGLGVGDQAIKVLTINPKNSNDIFMGLSSDSGSIIFRSIDGGDRWFAFSDGLPSLHSSISALVVDTVNNRIYAGGVGIYILDSLTTSAPVEAETELTPLRRTVRMVKLGGKDNCGYGSTAIYKGIEDRSCPRGRVWVTIG
ncbi:MAG: hypothetical protein HYR76_00790 [Ignavibacteria bacterium]|nr:hypothetical protein [Ignavibacteria bacterium]